MSPPNIVRRPSVQSEHIAAVRRRPARDNKTNGTDSRLLNKELGCMAPALGGAFLSSRGVPCRRWGNGLWLLDCRVKSRGSGQSQVRKQKSRIRSGENESVMRVLLMRLPAKMSSEPSAAHLPLHAAVSPTPGSLYPDLWHRSGDPSRQRLSKPRLGAACGGLLCAGRFQAVPSGASILTRQACLSAPA
jgi:hypothetical protein